VRGFLVVLPMRHCFWKSTGTYLGVGRSGLAQAEDMAAVLDHLAPLPEADAARAVVLGQSDGGPTTLSLSRLDSYRSRPVWEAMHAAYVSSGGRASMVAFGTFATGNAHAVFSSRAGQAIWLPEFDRFAPGHGLMSGTSATSATSAASATR
jgi:hypothetical protein